MLAAVAQRAPPWLEARRSGRAGEKGKTERAKKQRRIVAVSLVVSSSSRCGLVSTDSAVVASASATISTEIATQPATVVVFNILTFTRHEVERIDAGNT